jgi:C4-dicarboxylate transporter DctM subunit
MDALITALLIVALFALLGSGVWIGLALSGVAWIGMELFSARPAGDAMAVTIWGTASSWTLTALPLFVWMGEILFRTRLSEDMFRGLAPWLERVPGRLLHTNIIGCTIFAAVSGSSAAPCATIGKMTLPELKARGYPDGITIGTLAGAGTLGLLIPPSIIMIVYGVTANVSIAQLFIAGVIPGIMLATMLGITTWYRARKGGYPRMPRATWGEKAKAGRDSFWGLMLIVIVIGGIYTGIFTPTEAAAVSAVYAFVIAVFVYKDLGLKDVPRVLLSSANLSAMLLYIITNAVLFSFLMTSEQIPQAMADWMIGQGFGAIGFLLLVNVMLLLAGNVMEPSSIILITAPILFPVAMKLGIDPIHFGILITVNMEVGMCHPPVGLNLYVSSGIAKMGITELTIAVWPWLLTMLVFLAVVTYWAPLSTWLPTMLGMM